METITQKKNIEVKKFYILVIRECLAGTQFKDFVILHSNEIAGIIIFTALSVYFHLAQKSFVSKLSLTRQKTFPPLCKLKCLGELGNSTVMLRTGKDKTTNAIEICFSCTPNFSCFWILNIVSFINKRRPKNRTYSLNNGM